MKFLRTVEECGHSFGLDSPRLLGQLADLRGFQTGLPQDLLIGPTATGYSFSDLHGALRRDHVVAFRLLRRHGKDVDDSSV
jgi:hypothetical protein